MMEDLQDNIGYYSYNNIGLSLAYSSYQILMVGRLLENKTVLNNGGDEIFI